MKISEKALGIVRWVQARYRRYPLSPVPKVTPSERTAEELEAERRKHLKEQDRLRRLEYLYVQQQVLRRQKKEGEHG